MKFTDLISIVWNNMWRRKARTILTMLGVIIGTIAIFVIVSISNGFQSIIIEELNSFGDANTIYLSPYNDEYAQQSGKTADNKKQKTVLNDKTLKELKNLDFVKYCTPVVNTVGSLKFKKFEKNNVYLQGMELKNYSKDHKLLYGKFPSDSKDECTIGHQLAQQLINAKNYYNVSDESLKALLKKNIKIIEAKTLEDGTLDTKEFNIKITGIQNETLMDNSSIICPINTVKAINQYINGNGTKNNGYTQINVIIKSNSYFDEAEKYFKNNGYMYSSIKEQQQSVNKTLDVIKLVLGTLGGISLFVAAFGIANTMNMAIYERKKEIGVMKVVGAGLMDVKAIFIGEASSIGLAGGVIGVLLGLLINFFINLSMSSKLSASSSSTAKNLAVPDIGLIVFVLIFATVIGFLSGLYPASRAAKLNVIDSIKDE